MAYDITQVKADVEAALHGTTVNQVQNIYGAFNRAARDLLADCDPIETLRTATPTPLFSKVYDYVCPSDLKGDRIVDIRPQVNRTPNDNVAQTFLRQFDLVKDSVVRGALTAVKWNTAVKTLRIAVDPNNGVLLNSCDSLTQNGTWAASGTLTNLSVDTQNFVEGSGSLKADLAIGTGIYENSTMTAIDLSDQLNEGSLFVFFYIPNDTITSATLRWGSSSSDYWSVTVTSNQDTASFQLGWNLLKFDWDGATVTGSPDEENIDYLRFSVVTAATMPNVRLDGIYSRLGVFFDIDYYSKFLFRDASTGAFKEKVTADTDILNLDVDSYQLFFNKTMQIICQQMQGVDALAGDGPFYTKAYTDSLLRYQAKYPSQLVKPSLPYYPLRRGGYTRYVGTRPVGRS